LSLIASKGSGYRLRTLTSRQTERRNKVTEAQSFALRFVDRRESKEPVHTQYGRVIEVVEPDSTTATDRPNEPSYDGIVVHVIELLKALLSTVDIK